MKRGAVAAGLLTLGGVASSGTAAADIGEGRVLDFHLNNINYDVDKGTKIPRHVHDVSPAKNHGEWTNGDVDPVVKSGAVGNAFTFDGDGEDWDPVSVIEISYFPNLTGSLTIAGWINTTNPSAQGQRVFADDASNSGGYALSVGDGGTGTVRFYSRGKDTVSLDTGNVINSDTWHHVAGVYDDAAPTRRIYVDGNMEAELLDDTGMWGTDGGVASVGGEATTSGEIRSVKGMLDEVRVYDRALSAAEIQDLVDMRDTS